MPVPEAERERYLLLELACSFYARDVLSLGRAAELAGLSKAEFGKVTGARGIAISPRPPGTLKSWPSAAPWLILPLPSGSPSSNIKRALVKRENSVPRNYARRNCRRW